MSEKVIHVQGARVNNLKNISLDIPQGKLVVVTGLSGSGKSSLAFDTLYAEGQRRYVESLNSYARQFLGRMAKPECDFITGLPPAIAIEQKVIARNPRSTVGTSTEIYEYLRLLYARIGRTISPISGQEVKKHTTEDVLQTVLSYSEGTRFLVICPLRLSEGRSLPEQLRMYLQEGYTRLVAGADVVRIEDYLEASSHADDLRLYLLIDRLSVPRADNKEAVSRLMDSAETAFYEGGGEMLLRFMPACIDHHFSTRFEADGMTFEEPSDQLFAFNSPYGACPECQGWGNVVGIDPRLVIPNTALSVYEGCVQCWRGDKMSEWKDEFIRQSEPYSFPIFKPYYELTQKERDLLWHGDPNNKAVNSSGWPFPSIDAFFEYIGSQRHKIQYRVMLSRYTGRTVCPSCQGTRLRKEATYVKIAGCAITDLVDLPLTELKLFFDRLTLTDHEEQIARRLLTEIRSRIQFLLDVGLGYLTLSRPSNTLSGGESQRINLATSLGSSLVGSLYILDEPSIGLHPRDTARLIGVLHQLVQLGNTVVVVEHDEDIMRAADWLIDIGPEAGRGGGEVVWEGSKADLARAEQAGVPEAVLNRSYTLQYLLNHFLTAFHKGEEISRRPWNMYVEVKGARANNLRGIDVKFPLNVLTVVTGVSGSGKSTLVRDILYCALKRRLDEAAPQPGEHTGLAGDVNAVGAVEFVDQNPIGKSSRSNPVIYVKAYDEIRRLYAEQPLSKQLGFTASFFSFNTEGGRCEECKGEGTVTVEMQFMADLVLECESCHGHRFKSDLLDVRFHDMNIDDVLNMTVNQAIEFFAHWGEKRIVRRLKPLQDVGLGYVKLGQSSSTLSGGENQRVKLAYYIGQEKMQPTLFIFDEPTTGLHSHDIAQLLQSFSRLIENGHTVVVIEHNLHVIRMADHIIDLGPEGGAAGGDLVAVGTPEEIVAAGKGYTAKALE
ncbi:MAG: excinuclease ABC subunit UvrA [Bacteroidaceae bacterium]|nr:excinuclease ABC subunit UvrA [Bacteroidaceae bacterium]